MTSEGHDNVQPLKSAGNQALSVQIRRCNKKVWRGLRGDRSDISPDWKRSALDEEESKDVTGIWKKIRENIFLSFCAYTKKKPGQEHLTRHTIVSIFHGAQA
ncbi:uncharacterized protein LOC143788707 isoform X1 [Ranitomeya variabilis]|uniref:uncharacterized protein LOC143788707 isoform X1 n=1 Tax=Ranitomeya variabilis TaxID=490064 RepID=UPI0040571D76